MAVLKSNNENFIESAFEKKVLIPNIHQDIEGRSSFCIIMKYSKYSIADAINKGIITSKELTNAQDTKPVIHSENNDSITCSGSAFLLNPYRNGTEFQELYFATGRHNICKQYWKESLSILKLESIYLTTQWEFEECKFKKLLIHPLIPNEIDEFMADSTPDITFLKLTIDKTNKRIAKRMFERAVYFIPRKMSEIPVINGDVYNFALVCISGKVREIDFDRLKRSNPSIEWTSSLKKTLIREHCGGFPVWSFGQTKGCKEIDNLEYICYNCSSTPGCSGGACVLVDQTQDPDINVEKCLSFIGVHKGYCVENNVHIATPFHLVKHAYKKLVYNSIKNCFSKKDKLQVEQFLGEEFCLIL